MSILLLVLIALVIYLLYKGLYLWYTGDIYVQYVEYLDGHKPFRVIKSPEEQKALHTLRMLDKKGRQLLALYQKQYGVIPTLHATYQTMPWKEGHSYGNYPAYTVNKGDLMAICLRDKQGQWVDDNTLIYVLIHELAHLVTIPYGHGPQFWRNMTRLMKLAQQANMYNPVDYRAHPVSYCGMTIGK